MAFFKLRKAPGETTVPAPAPESVDALRRRARYRLAGAAILVLAGVIGFPLLFDNQPRPIAVDIPIDIPDKAKVKPLAIEPSTEPKAVAVPAAEPDAAAPAIAASRSAVGQLSAKAVTPDAKQETKPQPKEVQKEEVIVSSSKAAFSPAPAKTEVRPAAKVEAKVEAGPAEKKADKPANSVGRFVVQFGAFTDSARAHEARLKVEKTGLKTYAQIAETPDGKKFRVRVGPFDNRSDAEKAAEKIKMIGLPVSILGL
jgi:DedD protein